MKNAGPYWFPAKRYGWGWGPPTLWQGWAVVVGAFLAMGIAGVLLMPGHPAALLAAVVLISMLLLLIGYAKGEPPRWRWGD